jgi:tetratricopeptide (TPR) repeat protein
MTRARRAACATFVLAAVWTLSTVPLVHAANPGFATLEAAAGEVVVLRQGQPVALAASLPLQLEDVVLTKRGRATVRFQSDGSVLRVGPDTRVQVNESATERGISVFFGRVWAHVVRWRERPTRFESGSTIAAIRGTEIAFAVDGDETQVAVLEGHVHTQTDAGQLELAGGQVAVGSKGKAPTLVAQVKPLDAVRWALYYLPVVQLGPTELGSGQGWQAKAKASAEAARKGELTQALAALDGVAENDVRESRFFSYRASLLLATGSVDAAAKDIDRALRLSASDADALSLQAVVAVVGNKAELAVESARKAVAADSKSATARVAQSYARQARFDLAGADESLETAVTLAPGDALAWARLAELRSALGQREEALAAAQKASSLDPDLARTQSVLGFAYLAEVKTSEARAAFEKAAKLDPSDPLARLGLGLAKIRDGALDEGSRDLEVAVSLDPGQSLLRSYLGKAYYEQKREPLVGREYELARKTDPKDPTPWLYDAIFKQTTNRPVEALESLQEAIALNDNRAVYRSRLLLDSDLAARSASLGRVYSDLGFQETALVEGWQSVDTDPANFSAHRLLADSYAVRPRHEIARVSELFQSQMLQPLNTTPIQPTQGESNLLLISSQGPASASFNEFNPLFNRDQLTAQGSFMAGEDSTLAGEGIVSGIYKKLSFSAGYAGYDSDGFRQAAPDGTPGNAQQNDKIANAFLQAELSPGTSVQGELRYRNLKTGDLSQNFDGSFSPFLNEKTDGTNVRVGLRHDFGTQTTVLASYMHADKDINSDEANPAGLNFSLARKEKANSAEGQVLYKAPHVRVVAGAGYFDIGTLEDTTTEIVDVLTQTTAADTTIKHTNLYAYAYLTPVAGLTLTAGASGDLFDQTANSYAQGIAFPGVPSDGLQPADKAPVLGEKNQFNPKLGASWSFPTGTTLRAAWFRTLKRTLVTDQTLEPTQVAGFNQFFDDASATKSDVWGAAINQKLGKRAFAGFDFMQRDMTIPQNLFDVGPPAVVSIEERTGKEDLAHGYLFGAPHRWFTLGAEYSYEKFERDPSLFLPYQQLKTHRVPLSARFFHPSGISAFASATWIKQQGDFLTFDDSGQPSYYAGEQSFWVVDAGLRYRLPKRYGFLVAGVNNLADERSSYQSTDLKNLAYRPGRVVYGRLVVAFP